jgi:hypothetical protein
MYEGCSGRVIAYTLALMDIGVPVRSFGKVEMQALAAAILAADEAAWNENVER